MADCQNGGAIAGSYTTTQLGTLLRLAAARIGIRLDLYESPYGQYQQDIIDPGSPLYRFSTPDIVVLAVHEDVHLAEFSSDPTAEIQAEITRWTTLWNLVTTQSRARIVSIISPLPNDIPAGHLATGFRLPLHDDTSPQHGTWTGGGNRRLHRGLRTPLCIDRQAAMVRPALLEHVEAGRRAGCLAAKHTAASYSRRISADRKCLVLDLNNTLRCDCGGWPGRH
ncbi:MAG: hypothetical protein MRJ92_07910 [Nitrospira sp.]|nr:hypothetical protein [Nitrospira sp.]